MIPLIVSVNLKKQKTSPPGPKGFSTKISESENFENLPSKPNRDIFRDKERVKITAKIS
jgi:hypothetical protein